MTLLGWALLFAAAGLALVARASGRRAAPGIDQRIRWIDVDGSRRPARTMFDRHHGLVGRPDGLIEINGHVVPLEHKPSRRSGKPRDADILQLGAYCLLVESERGVPPPFGVLCYEKQCWRVIWNTKLRRGVIGAIESIRSDRARQSVARSHEEPGRCVRCVQRSRCDEQLG